MNEINTHYTVKKDVIVVTQVRLTYDPADPRVISALDDYRACIYKDADLRNMLNAIVCHCIKRGTHDMIEGIGYVNRPNEDLYCGIDVQIGDPEIE